MLWDPYVFRRDDAVHELWDRLFESRPIRLLYICGAGFDVRAQTPVTELVENLVGQRRNIEHANMLAIQIDDYELDEEIVGLVAENSAKIKEIFSKIGESKEMPVASTANDDDDLSASAVLQRDVRLVLGEIDDYTDIILDVSSLPRVVYLALLTGLLKVIVNPRDKHGLGGKCINLQVLVAEDAKLDGKIRAEDPSNDLVMIPGFASVMHAESVKEWPMVWFPILGENRAAQLEKLIDLIDVSDATEICPVLPHPSRNPRRGDELLVEYISPLFDTRSTPMTNILYVDEMNPFEAYRQLLTTMQRYCESLKILGGCRLIVTPLGSKLVTLGAGLACFEMQRPISEAKYGVAMPHAGPKRYQVAVDDLRSSKPRIASMLLSGEAYV